MGGELLKMMKCGNSWYSNWVKEGFMYSILSYIRADIRLHQCFECLSAHIIFYCCFFIKCKDIHKWTVCSPDPAHRLSLQTDKLLLCVLWTVTYFLPIPSSHLRRRGGEGGLGARFSVHPWEVASGPRPARPACFEGLHGHAEGRPEQWSHTGTVWCEEK